MSYRTAILIDRYEKSFSDSELQAQVTTTVEYDADLQEGFSVIQEVTSASIGNYPGHKIENAISTPFSVTIVGEKGQEQTVSMDKQQNLMSTHKKVLNGVTYVRVRYHYGEVEIGADGKKHINVMPQSALAPYVWHCNLEEVVASFSWDEYFTTNGGQKLAETPDSLTGVFILTEDQYSQDPYGEAPDNDKVWPALKILTTEDFKDVYLSEDGLYYLLVEIDGTEILLGSVYEQEEPPYTGTFLKGELLQETIDAAIVNDGEEEVVTLDMKFGDEYYRIMNTEEVVRVTDDPSGDVTEPDDPSGDVTDPNEYTLILANVKVGVSKSMQAVAQHRGDSYGEMSLIEITNYVTEHSKTVPAGLRVDYPEVIHEEEFEGIEEALLTMNETLSDSPTKWKFVKNTELDESKPPYRIVLFEDIRMNAIKDIRTVSTCFNGPYSGLSEATDLVDEALDQVTGEIVYPADFTMEEINLFKTKVETDSVYALKGEYHIINAE